MTEFGQALRNAREAKGLSIAQISEATNMLPQQIEDLEKENFSRIAAPIYGRGFVKLYCNAVGLDPKPFVQEFMDIYNGNKQPTIKFRKTMRAAEPIPVQMTQEVPAAAQVNDNEEEAPAIRQAAIPITPTEQPQQETPPPPPPPTPPTPPPPPTPPTPPPEPERKQEYEFTDDESAIIHAAENPQPAESIRDSYTTPAASAAQEMRRAVEAQPFRLEQETISIKQTPQAKNDSNISRYGTPAPILKPDSRYSDFYIPPVVWRAAIVIAVICLAGWLLFALGSKVWRAATNAPDDPLAADPLPCETVSSENPNKTAVSEPSESSKPRQERVPMKLPPLYFE